MINDDYDSISHDILFYNLVYCTLFKKKKKNTKCNLISTFSILNNYKLKYCIFVRLIYNTKYVFICVCRNQI